MPESVTQRMVIRVPGKPIPWYRSERGLSHSYTNPRAAAWRDLVVLVTTMAKNTQIKWVDVPKGLPVSVSIDFLFRRPRNHTRVQRMLEPFKPTRADKDNLEKAVLDALGRAQVYADDGQVVDGRIRKLWSNDNWQGAIITVASGDYLIDQEGGSETDNRTTHQA